MRFFLLAVCTLFMVGKPLDIKADIRIPSRDDREKMVDYFVRFSEFPRITIVRETGFMGFYGELNPPYDRLFQKSKWVDGLGLLQIHSLDIKVSFKERVWRKGEEMLITSYATSQGETLTISYVVSLRYQEEGFLEWYLGALGYGGTIECLGAIDYLLKSNNIHSIRVTGCDDSKNLERLKRKMGLIEKYNLEFAQNIIVPVLEDYFNSDTRRIRTLLETIGNPWEIAPKPPEAVQP